MVLGSTWKGIGQLLFYRSPDGLTWTAAGRFGDEALGTTLECPDLFCLEGRWVLLGSPMGITADGLAYPDQSTWMPVTFDETTCTLALEGRPTFVDWGLDLYAPQTTLDAEGRRVLIGWIRMPGPVTDAPDGPRPLAGHDEPAPAGLLAGRAALLPGAPQRDGLLHRTGPGPCPAGRPPAGAAAGQTAGRPGLDIGGLRIRREGDRLLTDRSEVFGGLTGYRLTAEAPPGRPRPAPWTYLWRRTWWRSSWTAAGPWSAWWCAGWGIPWPATLTP